MKETTGKRLLWLVPESKGGIRDYGETLGRAMRDSIPAGSGIEWVEKQGSLPTLEEVRDLSPCLIHVQHEYGLFGGKNPPRYSFPRWIRELRTSLPQVLLVATAHTVLAWDYRYPVAGRGIQIPARILANALALPWLRSLWGRQTWGGLDAVVVHSAEQVGVIARAGTPKVEMIPHFVFPFRDVVDRREPSLKHILVFGFFTRGKGQDVAIRALASLGKGYRLILAGGVRRPEDQVYLESCLRLIDELVLKDRVEITGFVPVDQMDAIYGIADLVLAPFHETSGSGSLAQAFARGMPILASDLICNRELVHRVPGCLALFESGSPKSAAREIERLLSNHQALDALRESSRHYASRFALEKIAEQHWALYKSLLRGRP